jgi:hypothetical protein
MDPIEFLSRFFPPRGDVFHLTSMYIAISHHSISRPRSLFFSSPCCRGWISLYTTRKPSSFFLILSDFSHFFFFYWIRSWIIQKKGYTYYTAPCVCVYIALKAGCLSYIGWMCVYTGGRVKRPVGASLVYKSRVYTHRSCIWLPYFGPQGFL